MAKRDGTDDMLIEEVDAPPPPKRDFVQGDRVLFPDEGLRMRVDVGFVNGKPLKGAFKILFSRHLVLRDGTLKSSPDEEIEATLTPQKAARAVIFVWTAVATSPPERSRFKVRITVGSSTPAESKAAAAEVLVTKPPMTVTLTEVPADLADIAKEEVRGWPKNRVFIDFPDISSFKAADAKGVASFKSRTPALSIAVARKEPHAQSILWASRPASGSPATLTPATPAHTLALGTRLRFSVWSGVGSPFIDEDAATPAKSGILVKSRGLIDDFSFLETMVNDGKASTDLVTNPLDVELTRLKFGTLTTAKKVEMYNKLIDACHEVGAQALIGFAIVAGEGAARKRFNNWLLALRDGKFGTGAPPPPGPNDPPIVPESITVDDGTATEIRRFAGVVADFAVNNFPNCDGISFDVEAFDECSANATTQKWGKGSTTGQWKGMRVLGRYLARFYQEVADRLAPSNRIVGVAGGGMISEWEGTTPGLPVGIPAAPVHPYDMPLGHPNLLFRPMCYDNFARSTAWAEGEHDAGLFAWHQTIIEFALGKKGLHPSQFQLGMKIFQGDIQTKGVRNRDGTTTFFDGVVPFKTQAAVDQWGPLLRKHRVGPITFALLKSTPDQWDRYKPWNDLVNDPFAAGSPLPTRVFGQPLHAPLDAVRLGLLK